MDPRRFFLNPANRCRICMILVVCCSIVCSSDAFERRGQRRQRSENNVVAEMQVVCRSDSILLKVDTNSPFNGMIYAKEAPNGNNCMTEYSSATNMTFRLPLKSCGTLFAEADDGIEYFNTIIVQPHMRLMTNQGRGYHIRCKYQTRERTIANTHFNVSASFPMQNGPQSTTTPLLATASMPSCTMKIFRSGRDDVAEAVKIGDKLIMVIEIDQQDMYGMRITNCVVRDGLNLAEQQLINDSGCPIDETIMPKFDYTNNFTRAAVSFPAHKFPLTSSVYYQCNVRLCISNNGGCTPVSCNGSQADQGGPATAATGPSTSISQDAPRRKRMADHDQDQPMAEALNSSAMKTGPGGMSFDVYSGLYVSDLDVGESGSSDVNAKVAPNQPATNPATREQDEAQPRQICMTPGQVSPLILIGSLGLLATLFMLLCQIGVFGVDQQIVANKDNTSSSSKPLAIPAYGLAHDRQQRRRHFNQCNASAVADCRQPYHCYSEALA